MRNWVAGAAVAACLVCSWVEPGMGAAAVWTNTAGGGWSTLSNWQGSAPPGLGTNVEINVSGVYTSALLGSYLAADVAVGTTSAAGVQTLEFQTTSASVLMFSNMMVGARGVVAYGDNSSFQGTGVITVASGGLLQRKAGVNQGSFADHQVALNAGGRWTIASGAAHTIGSPVSAVTNLIDGRIDGPGRIDFNNSGQRTVFTGTGRIDVAQLALNNGNGNLYLGGTLHVGSQIAQLLANSSSMVLMSNALITLDGPYDHSGGGNVLVVPASTDIASVTGTNSITLRHSAGQYTTLGGTRTGAGGHMTIGGTGPLTLTLSSTTVAVFPRFQATALTLARPTTISATPAAISAGCTLVKWSGACDLSVSNGVTMLVESNIVLRLYSADRNLKVGWGSTLSLNGVTIEGRSNGTSDDIYNLIVGKETPGTLSLAAGITNLFRRCGEGTAAHTHEWILLGTNATIAAGTGSLLALMDARLAIAVTNPASFGWISSGALGVDSNSYVEALSSDRGTNVILTTRPLYLNELAAYVMAGPTPTLTLWNMGSSDNDLDGTNDAALYVNTLNLTNMAAGQTLTLAGSGILSPKLYYVSVLNPNGAMIGANILPLGPQMGTLSCTIANVPVPAGAAWRATSGASTNWNSSGASLSEVPGAYTVTFQTIPYFFAPSDQAVTVAGGQTTNVVVSYTTNANWGGVSVTLQPAGAVANGAQWRLTSGPSTNWNNSGAVVDGLEAGAYTVTYRPDVPSWFEPANDAVTVLPSQTTSVTATYTSVPVYTLTVISPYGQASPAAGTHAYELGQNVVCSITNAPLTVGTTQYVATGWVRVGSAPGSGGETNTAFTMTGHTTNTWLWETNYLLSTAASGPGSVDQNGTWARSAGPVTVTATPLPGYAFQGWSGNVPLALTNNNPLALPMDQPRSIVAAFAPASGSMAVWTNAAGTWSVAGNWLTNFTPAAGIHVDINASGTYTSTLLGTFSAADVYLGTRSAAGVQTLEFANSGTSSLLFSNLLVGAHGVLRYADNSFLQGTGTITVASGGKLERYSSVYQGVFADHAVNLEAGARWTIATNAAHVAGVSPSGPVTNTINGVIDGLGRLEMNNGSVRTVFTGTGRIDVAQIALNANNGNLYLGGTLHVGSTIAHLNANGSSVVLMSNALITLDGPYEYSLAGNVLFVNTAADSAAVTGTNRITLLHSNPIGYTTLGGNKATGVGGQVTIGGTGPLTITLASGYAFQTQASVLTFARPTTVMATVANPIMRSNGSYDLVVSNGVTLALETNVVLRLFSASQNLKVGWGSMLSLNGATLECRSNGTGDDIYNVAVGRDTPATLRLGPGAVNRIKYCAPEGSGTAAWVLIGSNATVTAGAATELAMADTRLAIAFTNTAAWGLSSAGTIAIGSNVTFEALNTFSGPSPTAAYLINELSFTGSGPLTLTLANDGSWDNDRDGVTDQMLYVSFLDLSGMDPGTSVSLAAASGSGITTPRVLYNFMNNPNAVTLSADFIHVIPATTIMMFR